MPDYQQTAAGVRSTDVAIDSLASDNANNQIDEQPQIIFNGRRQRMCMRCAPPATGVSPSAPIAA